MKSDTPSNTAYLVALGSFLVLRHDPSLVWDSRMLSLLKILLSHSPWHFRMLWRLSHFACARKFFERTMSLVIPGMFLHYVARKKKLEEISRAIIEQGIEQIVVVSGGFDTLSVRLSLDYPQIKVFEYDHPATQICKTSALKMERNNVTFVAADLTRVSLADALQKIDFNAKSPTLFLFEGILMYLHHYEVEEQMCSLAKLCRTSHLLFTFFEANGSSIGFQKGSQKFVNMLLRRSNEPFLWETTFSALSQMLNSCGWNTKTLLRADDFQLPSVPTGFHPAAVGECIAHCYTSQV